MAAKQQNKQQKYIISLERFISWRFAMSQGVEKIVDLQASNQRDFDWMYVQHHYIFGSSHQVHGKQDAMRSLNMWTYQIFCNHYVTMYGIPVYLATLNNHCWMKPHVFLGTVEKPPNIPNINLQFTIVKIDCFWGSRGSVFITFFNVHPETWTINPKSWRLGSDDFSFWLGDC